MFSSFLERSQCFSYFQKRTNICKTTTDKYLVFAKFEKQRNDVFINISVSVVVDVLFIVAHNVCWDSLFCPGFVIQ